MTDQKLYCAFCAKDQDEVSVMVEGPGVHICGECVRCCVETLRDNGQWPVATNDSLRRGLMALAAYIGPSCTAAVTYAMGDSPSCKEPSNV